MAANQPPPERAFYDAEGDIVLRGKAGRAEPEPTAATPEDIVQWIITEEDPPDLHQCEQAPDEGGNAALRSVERNPAREHITRLRMLTRRTVREGVRQYTVSIRGGLPLLGQASRDLRHAGNFLWAFLAQPVWIPGRHNTVRQYSRGSLFVLDVLRFGTTFGIIFLVLFSAMNAASFWQITRSTAGRFLRGPSIDTGSAAPESPLIQALKTTALTAEGRERGDLLSILPTVGPPENRLLIPKLDLNVPLMNPRSEALLRQDWSQVEEDIQEALQGGVVHYPGTARPGQAGNFFVTGHSSYYPWAPGKYKTVFARLPELDVGDEYWIYFKGDRHRYVIRERKEVAPSDVSVLDQPESKRLGTLMTCVPVGTTLRRLILVAQEVHPLTGEPLKVGERGERVIIPRPQLEALPI